MKIFNIIDSLGSGGAERFVVDLGNELSLNPNYSITIVTILDDKIPINSHYLHEISDRVNYICLRSTKGLSCKALYKVFSLIRKAKPDVVHAHCGLLQLLLPILFFRGIHFVHTLHTVAEKQIIFPFLKRPFRYLYQKYVTPVTISRVCDLSYQEFYGLKNSRCIYNGRSLMQTSCNFTHVKEEIDSYKENANTIVFLHVARFDESKNQKMLVDAFERLALTSANFVLLIIGAHHEKASYYGKINSSRIRILGEKNNVVDYLACSDFFVLTSLWEGLPISLLEAMAVGCVPVCTPAGGIPDILKHGYNGFLANGFGCEEFYHLLCSVVGIDNYEQIKRNAKDFFAQNLTMKICAKKYETVYENV